MHEQKKIGAALRSIRMKINANIEENRTLSKLRDSLLPKLMSGELDVSNLDL
jgi:type I restriction enzyme S subunit